MTEADRTARTSVPARAPSSQAEAARYALLRRLAPSMRHHLVGNLQPIGMIYEVMDRRLRAPEPDLGSVHDNAHKMNGFARAALESCLEVVTWLAPDEGAVGTVADGVRECVGLLASSLSFRGYALRNEVPAPTAELPGHVRRSALRNVLTGALIHVTDEMQPPADLVLTAVAAAAGVELTLTARPTGGNMGFAGEPSYRQLEWDDLEALAGAESVGLLRPDKHRISLSFPWVRAAPP